MRASAIETIRRALADNPKKTIDNPSLSPAGVLVVVYPKDGEYCVLLNKRSQLVEHHKGEISFPGGSVDPEDESLLATAIRETHEEMGILPDDIEYLGDLDD
ncbi:MAG: CoA pyrophosphatase, partial [Chloroflexi bacterium]|nr:CoA pyrophosphatase [Chloroflexota bacterium]